MTFTNCWRQYQRYRHHSLLLWTPLSGAGSAWQLSRRLLRWKPLVSRVPIAPYAIPVSLAYASPASLPAQMSLYGYLLGAVGYALVFLYRLGEVRDNPEHIKILEEWMKSYKPEELFDENGRFKPDLAEIAPKGERRMSANPHANGGLLLRDLVLPDFRNYAITIYHVVNKKAEVVRVYLPPDANCLLSVTDHCFQFNCLRF